MPAVIPNENELFLVLPSPLIIQIVTILCCGEHNFRRTSKSSFELMTVNLKVYKMGT